MVVAHESYVDARQVGSVSCAGIAHATNPHEVEADEVGTENTASDVMVFVIDSEDLVGNVTLLAKRVCITLDILV